MSNAIRGYMAEYGLVAPVGRNGLQRLMAIIADQADDRLPARSDLKHRLAEIQTDLTADPMALLLSSSRPQAGWLGESRPQNQKRTPAPPIPAH